MNDIKVRPSDKTLRKGLRIVERLASDGPMALREVAEACSLSKGNAHHLLKTLIEEEYVRQDPNTGHYAATLRLWEFASRVYERIDLVALTQPVMQRLRDETRETVLLAILDGLEVVYLAKLDGLEAVRSHTKVGGRAPAYCVATGKALLAFTEFATPPWKDASFDAFNEKTIIDRDALEAELAQIRNRGYSVNRGEWRGAVRGLAAPIQDARSNVVAALGIAGPRDSLPQKKLTGLAPTVIEAAASVSRSLGARPLNLTGTKP